MFLIGHNALDIPDHFAHIAHCAKPIDFANLIDLMESQVGDRPSGST